MVSQFLNSPRGRLFLHKLGDIIQSETSWHFDVYIDQDSSYQPYL